MTQEQKELLLKDLCARLPYNVKCTYYDKCIDEQSEGTITGMQNGTYFVIDGVCIDVENVKPYLLPLSSMTEEQCYELASIRSGFQDCWKYIKTPIPLAICNFEQIDWFHRNHFDYRGLIENGLATDATNLNIY